MHVRQCAHSDHHWLCAQVADLADEDEGDEDEPAVEAEHHEARLFLFSGGGG